MGVGVVQITQISKTLLTVWVDEDAHVWAQMRSYVMTTTIWLLGPDGWARWVSISPMRVFSSGH